MQLNKNPGPEELAQVEHFAGLQFSRSEVEIITQISQRADGFALSYLRGALKKEAEIREAIFTAALNQSATAQGEALKMVKTRTLKS